MTTIADVFSSSPLITLLGPGGVGKTRTAQEVAARLRPFFPDGIWLVELAPTGRDKDLIPELARALNLTEDTGQPLPEVVMNRLRSQQLLLILDNCEHLLDAC